MVRKKLTAAVVALGICVIATPTTHAETALPEPGAMSVPDGKRPWFSMIASFFDDFADDSSEHKKPIYSSPVRETFAGPYDLPVTEGGDRDFYGMMLASLGMMALIAHRRRLMQQ